MMTDSSTPPHSETATATLPSYLQRVASLLAGRQAQQALQLAKEALNRYPASEQLHVMAGVCAATLGDSSQAELYWRRAIELDPQTTQAHHNLGLLYTNNRADLAEHHYRQAIALDPNNPTIYSNLGVLLANLNRNDEAEQSYRRAIALNPGNAMAHSNLGVLLAKLHRLDEAEQCYRNAVELDAANLQSLSNLGNLLARRERYEEAEQCYCKALMLNPDDAATYANLGRLLSTLKRDDEAEQCYRKLIALNPGHAAAHFNLGIILGERKQDNEAERCYRQAIALDPGNTDAYSNLGVLLAKHKHDDEAEQCYRRSLAIDPEHAMAHSNLGLLLAKRKHHDEAELCYRKAIALAPDATAALTNLALLLEDLKRYAEAEQYYRRAIACTPDAAILHSNLGLFLTRVGREQEAEQCFRQAMFSDPGFAVARVNLGFLLLRQGRLEEGWTYFEARNDPGLPEESRHPYPINAPFPQWRGEALAGKSLLVWPEQGFGDEIQFCRYLPLLKQQGAARITLVCKPPLKPLLTTLAGVDEVIAFDESGAVISAHDYWTYPLSIPVYCRTILETIPAQLPYLHALPDRIAKWAARLPRDGFMPPEGNRVFRVGLVWKGSTIHTNDSKRSLPGLATLAPLWSVPGTRFVSLQKGQGEDEAAHPPAGQPLLDLGIDIADFADTAAIVTQLDLVISVDTAVAHVAGALAIPCWVLLPAEKVDWRWLHGREDSPWYPGVLRLFRQRDSEDRTALIMEVRQALVDEISNRRAST